MLPRRAAYERWNMPRPASQFSSFLSYLSRKLVKDHQEDKDEPLHLAIYYAPERQPQDVFLFEVLGNFGSNSIDPDRELSDVTFGPVAGLPIKPSQRLHLILTNPEECRVAFRENWALAAELREAIRDGKYQVLFRDSTGDDLWKLIHDEGASLVSSS
jgi:hypothetical protein